MNIFLLAPNYCWHTKDLISLSHFSKEFTYKFLPDTPPFLSRNFFKKYFNNLNFSYEFFQRIWRLFFCIPWSIYLKIRLLNNDLIHCHGLFALFIAHLAGISNSRIIFTPQGSDLLILPDQYFFLRNFLKGKLHKLSFITADSDLLLRKAVLICPKLDNKKLKLIQNGIPLENIQKFITKRNRNHNRQIDICWIRGLSSIYQFDYFLNLLETISKKTNSELNIAIISAYGNSSIPKRIFELSNLNIILMPRLNNKDFLKCLLNTKIVVSIPLSDSSPRSVYESIALGCKIFVSDLNCFDWLPKELKSEFIISKKDLPKDSENIINSVIKFKEFKDLNSLKNKFPYFFKSLDYNYIAYCYSKIFKNGFK